MFEALVAVIVMTIIVLVPVGIVARLILGD